MAQGNSSGKCGEGKIKSGEECSDIMNIRRCTLRLKKLLTVRW